uniref:Uncharacterized protein n=1 Tax=Oryza nivara TaxID=4536 RepID=A0A0E0J1T7_ORYNI
MPKMGSNYRGGWSVAGNTLVEAGVGRTDVKRPIEGGTMEWASGDGIHRGGRQGRRGDSIGLAPSY